MIVPIRSKSKFTPPPILQVGYLRVGVGGGFRLITGECYEVMGESKVGMGLVQKNITVAKHRARNGGGKEYCVRGGGARQQAKPGAVEGGCSRALVGQGLGG